MNLSRKEEAFEQRFRKKLGVPDPSSPLAGIGVCVALTSLAVYLHSLPFAPFTMNGTHPLSAVLLALILGLALRNTVPATARLKSGVDVVIRRLLPAGIVLLGARLDFYDLLAVGARVLFGAVVLIVLIILVARYACRFFDVEPKLGLLLGVGTAICGTSAIVATAPVVESKEKDIAISIAAINLLGALAMALFPFVGALLALPPQVYGEWCGLAIHATPQVIAAGFAHHLDGKTAGEIAMIVKLTRISLLGPVVFIIGLLYARHRRKQAVFVAPTVRYARLVPAFILFFIGMALLRTMGFFPQVTLHMTDRFIFGAGERVFDLAAILGQAGQWIITAAIAGVGLMTEFRVLKTAGRPFLLGLFLTAVLALLGILYAHWR